MKKYMFKILAVITLWVLTISVMAQENIIRLTPDIGQGWVVLDDFNHIVNYWEIRILSMSYNSNDEIVYEVADIIELVGKNYLHLDREYRDNPGYTLRAIAHLSDGGTIQEDILISPMLQELIGGNPWEFCKSFICNGPSYAYKIEHWRNTNTGHTQLRLNNAFTNDNPIYIYFDQNTFLNMLDINTTVNWPNMGPISFWDYYGISYNEYINYAAPPPPNPPVTTPRIIKIAHDFNSPKFNSQGNTITTQWIYGIAAGLGPWSGSVATNACIYSDPLTGLSCSSSPAASSIPDLYFAIQNMNYYTSPNLCGWPNYQCAANLNVNPTPWLGGLWKGDIYPPPKLPDSLLWIWDLFSMGYKVIHGDNIGNWWEDYHSISFTDISGKSGEIFNVRISDILINGQPDEVPVYITPGLFVIGMVDTEGNYIPVYVEKPLEEYAAPTPMADELQVNIFPVPHTENSFNMTLTSSAESELTVHYKLYSNQAILLHESTLIIYPEASETIWVSPEVGLPSGVLYHTFVFEDNSYKTICTIKNN